MANQEQLKLPLRGFRGLYQATFVDKGRLRSITFAKRTPAEALAYATLLEESYKPGVLLLLKPITSKE